jgi:hypothetical protein
MAQNLNVLTHNAQAVQVQHEYYSPVSKVQGSSLTSIYAFLGREDPWPYVDGVETPLQPQQDQQYLKKVFKNMFAVKLINTSNISPVIQRINWANNTTYVEYSDTVDMFAKDAQGYLINNFYVKNRYDQVFKCLANGNGKASTYEPYFQPGSYGTNNIYQNADGYKWKFMYVIDAGNKKNFMDANWMPVPISANTPQPYLTNAGCGDIEVINVTNGGSGYDAINTYITVIVTGDGSGVIANVTSAQVTNGIITDVVVKPGYAGKNYTAANVSIRPYTSANLKYTSTIGSGATAVSPTSPIGGHAYNSLVELGCDNVMYSVEFNGNEGGVIPTDGVIYHQVGILFDPQIYGANSPTELANNLTYNTTTQFVLSSGLGVYQADEIVQQFDTMIPPNLLFQGTVLTFNTSTNLLQLINTSGTFLINQAITGVLSGASRTVFTVSPPTLIPYSGYITYIENRVGVQRSLDGIEQFKFVLGF